MKYRTAWQMPDFHKDGPITMAGLWYDFSSASIAAEAIFISDESRITLSKRSSPSGEAPA
ncbi:MAG: hypothetical protein LKE81_00270 [Acetobacter sp.]|nr:hypothetical protein [Acetobacter sp.]MCH4086819.1 hypothetical protein [Acetobacter sp.]